MCSLVRAPMRRRKAHLCSGLRGDKSSNKATAGKNSFTAILTNSNTQLIRDRADRTPFQRRWMGPPTSLLRSRCASVVRAS
jgi:hypothetical protein